MSKRTRRKRGLSERILWLLSLLMVGSMVVSLAIVALPSGSNRTPTPPPTRTPGPTVAPSPTPSPSPSSIAFPTFAPTEPPAGPELPTQEPMVTPSSSPALEQTEPPAGPVLPTNTLEPTMEPTEPAAGPVLPTLPPTSTVTPTLTATPPVTMTPSSSSLEFTFAVCGDSRDNAPTYRRVLDAVTSGGSQFLLHTGDMVNLGSEEQWQAFQATMADFALPFYPVPGNHDGLEGKLDGFLAYSGAPAAHYSFDRAPVHFTLADSHNGGISAAELSWLRDDLSVTDQPVKMVFLHHPPFDPDGTDHIMAYGNESFMALMIEQKVDYVFAGHIHAYAQEERDGVVYVITGGAGAPLYGQDHPQAFYHYLRVNVEGEDVNVEVVKI